MSNFDQYVFTLPKEQGPIHLTLSELWDKLRKDQRAVTMPAVRRLVLRPIGVKGNPAKLTIQPGAVGYAEIIEIANTTTEHVAKFDNQRLQAQLNKRGRKLLAEAEALILAGTK